MSRFNSNDQLMLESLVEEGFLDRLKAQGSQALGAVKGLGNNLMQGASAGGLEGKVDSYKNSARKIIQKAFTEIASDLKKLGIQLDPDRIATFNKFAAEMQNSLNETLDTFKQGGPTGATPPPLPQESEPEVDTADYEPETASSGDGESFDYTQEMEKQDNSRSRYTPGPGKFTYTPNLPNRKTPPVEAPAPSTKPKGKVRKTSLKDRQKASPEAEERWG